MSSSKSDTRTQVASLVEQALALGPRKELRTTLLRALEIAKGETPKELTQLHYDRLGSSSRLADPHRPGLIMKSTKTGLKRWTYRTEVDGKQREITIGHYPEMGVAEARDRWADLRNRRAEGGAPDTRDSTTLRELVDHYVTWAAENLRSWRKNQLMLERHLLPGREDITLAELDADHLNAAISAIAAKTPQAARQLRSAISGTLKRGKKDNMLPKGFAVTPGMLVETDSSGVRSWHPSTAELRTFLTAVDDMGELGAPLRLIALTGVRMREAVEMRWAEVDLSEGRWVIPAERMKAKRPHTVMLSKPAKAFLEARKGNGSEYVFPSPTNPAAHRNSDHLTHAWADTRDEAGLPAAFTTHTLRKALATWVAENGATRDIRDRMNAHALTSGADAHYSFAELNKPAGEWWQRWADHLAAIEGENVVTIEEVRA